MRACWDDLGIIYYVCPQVRVDAWASSGCVVSPQYDSVIGKVMARGPTRADALAALAKALDGTRLSGIASNLEVWQMCPCMHWCVAVSVIV